LSLIRLNYHTPKVGATKGITILHTSHNHTAAVENFSLTGQFLVAMPAMTDPNFSRSVIYICEHSPKGAMGLVVNKPTEITLESLFEKVALKAEIDLSGHIPVLSGGPVAGERGFVLHSNTAPKSGASATEGGFTSTLKVSERISMTTSKDILEAVARGDAPEHWLITLGYAGWGEGQLEREIADNAWLNVPADESLLFACPLDERFTKAFELLGFDLSRLSGFAGHA
jgi:putative transcriptional regulator